LLQQVHARFLWFVIASTCIVASSVCAEEITRGDKIHELRDAAAAARKNHELIRTWRGVYQYRSEAAITGQYGNSIKEQLPEADRNVELPLHIRTKGAVTFALDAVTASLSVHDDQGIVEIVEGTTGRVLNPAGLSSRDEYYLVTPKSICAYDARKLESPTPGAPVLLLKQLGNPSAIIYRKPRAEPSPPLWPSDANLWNTTVFDPRTFYGYDRPMWELLEMYALNLEGKDADRVDAILQLRKEEVEPSPQSTITLDLPSQRTEVTFARSVASNLVRYIEYQTLGNSDQQIPLREITWTYQLASDVYVPETVAVKIFEQGGTSIETERRFRLVECEINKGIDAGLFAVNSFPISDGTRLRDELNQESFFWKNDFLQLNDLQAKLSTPTETPKWRRILLVVAINVIAISILFWLFRRPDVSRS